MAIKVEVKNLYKIFGEHPEKAFKLIEAGKTKEQIFEKTGLSVGIKNASLSIKEGEIFVIMGLSGSGKSTMVRLFNQLIKPTRGQVMIDGEDITQVTDKRLRAIRRQKMSMVFQSFALMPHLNVIDNAAFGLELSGETRDIRREKALEALKQVGLENYANSYPDELSGGMCQRVGLARALANNPDILLMDEAFSALDPLIRAEMQDELIQLQAQQQRTIIFISHDLDEAMRIGDRIAIMQDGEVIQVGTPDEILNNPANDYVKTFFKGVDLGQVFSAKDIVRRHSISVIRNMPGMGPRSAIRLLQDKDHDFGYVIEKNYRFTGVVSIDSLKKSLAENLTVEDSLIEHPQAISGETQLNEIINQVATAPCALPVVDDKQKFLGVISKGRLLRALDRETSINE